MKKKGQRIISLVCCLAVLLSLLAGCGSNQESDSTSTAGKTEQGETTQEPPKTEEPTVISIFRPDLGRVVKDDNPVIAELEKRTNTKLEFQLVPAAEWKNKYSLLVASDTVPDLTRAIGFDYFQFVSQDIYLDLTPYLDKLPHVREQAPNQRDWDYVKYKGKQTAIPYVGNEGRICLVVRQDWLNKLGLKAPSTLDEFTEVARKFTLNDPDGNGKNDTYALTSVGDGGEVLNNFSFIFGAFGMPPQQYYIKDGKVYASSISQEYKSAVEYLAMLYKGKMIDPDYVISKFDQMTQKIASGKVGFASGGWSTVPAIAMDQLKMKQIVPEVEWTVIDPVKGPSGKSGYRSLGSINGTLSVSAKTKNIDAVLKFIDYLSTEEGHILSSHGIEGVHYTVDNQGRIVTTEAGIAGKNEKWLDLASQMAPTLMIVNEWREKGFLPQPAEYTRYQTLAMEAPLYRDDFYGISTPESAALLPELQKLEADWMTRFITGAEPISKFDEYVKQWKQKGGTQMMESMVKEYNSRTGKNITIGD